jgi:hypothetical protein
MARSAAVAAWLVLVLAGCGDEGSGGGEERSADTSRPSTSQAPPRRSPPPVKVTKRHLRFMAETVVSDFREEADLLDDRSDYSAKCRQTGRGKATCMITSYDQGGEKMATYPTPGRFDPANPERFEFPDASTGVTSPRGAP